MLVLDLKKERDIQARRVVGRYAFTRPAPLDERFITTSILDQNDYESKGSPDELCTHAQFLKLPHNLAPPLCPQLEVLSRAPSPKRE